MTTTETTVTFYICPDDGGYWSPAGAALMSFDPRDRINGGARQCPACAGTQAASEDEAYDRRHHGV